MLNLNLILSKSSVASPQFKDLLQNGNKSKYKDFFINWMNSRKWSKKRRWYYIPKQNISINYSWESLLPVLKVRFPDGTEQPYWNTFYQQITYNSITIIDLQHKKGLTEDQGLFITAKINELLRSRFHNHWFLEMSLLKQIYYK
jgi:sucrose phosphorylase